MITGDLLGEELGMVLGAVTGAFVGSLVGDEEGVAPTGSKQKSHDRGQASRTERPSQVYNFPASLSLVQ